MSTSYTDFGMRVNHFRNRHPITIPQMVKRKPTATVLWENVAALMRHHWQEENLNRLAREAKIGAATAQRIKDQQTSVRLETIDAVAMAFGLLPWQLLLPDLDPRNVPITMLSEDEKKLYAKFHRVKSIMEETT